MIFLFWLCIHLSAVLAHGVIVPSTPQYDARTMKTPERILMLLWYLTPCSWWLSRSEGSLELFGAGFVMYSLGAALVVAARLSNPHFRAEIVTPPEVIRTGVYRWLKHPGYVGMILQGLGSLLMLDNRAGYFPLVAYAMILMMRAGEEDRIIRDSQRDFHSTTEDRPLC